MWRRGGQLRFDDRLVQLDPVAAAIPGPPGGWKSCYRSIRSRLLPDPTGSDRAHPSTRGGYMRDEPRCESCIMIVWGSSITSSPSATASSDARVALVLALFVGCRVRRRRPFQGSAGRGHEALMRLKDGELVPTARRDASNLPRTMTASPEPGSGNVRNTVGKDGKLGQRHRGRVHEGRMGRFALSVCQGAAAKFKTNLLSIPAESGQSLKAAFDASGLSYDYETVVSRPAAVWINPAPETDRRP